MNVNNNTNLDPTARAQAAAQRGEQAYAKAKKEGAGGYAIDFWDGAAKNAEKDVKSGESWWITGNAKWAGAKVMGFFARMSGLDEIEGRTAQNQELWKGGASAWEKTKAGAWLTFEGAMAALNFTGIGGIVKGAGRRAAMRVAAKEGAELAARLGAKEGAEVVARMGATEGAAAVAGLGKAIKGMLPATPEAAAMVSRELGAVLAKLPTAGKLGAAELKVFQEGLEAVGKKYGIDMVFKTGAPQVLPEAGKITIYTTGAAWHETLHVVQAVQTQATATASMAQRLGKSVAELSPKELQQAYKYTAEMVEKVGYAAFEQQAIKASGFWQLGLNAKQYTKVVGEGLGQFERALVTGTTPNVAPGLGARIYGGFAKLGESQGELMANMGLFFSGVITRVRRSINP